MIYSVGPQGAMSTNTITWNISLAMISVEIGNVLCYWELSILVKYSHERIEGPLSFNI